MWQRGLLKLFDWGFFGGGVEGFGRVDTSELLDFVEF